MKKAHDEVQIAFYGGNFLGLHPQEMIAYLDAASEYINQGMVHSIRFSTRPDTIQSERLSILSNYRVKTIELGIQSMNDDVLKRVKRGHTGKDSELAIVMLKQYNYQIGVQFMVGLPGDTEQTLFETTQKIVSLAPDFVRIYPTIVLHHSELAKWYINGEFVPMTLAECVHQVKQLYVYCLRNSIPVIRMGLHSDVHLQQPDAFLAGPYHPAFGHLVLSEIFYDMAKLAIADIHSTEDTVVIHVHPNDISKMKGYQNQNIQRLQHDFGKRHIQIHTSTDLLFNQIWVNGQKINFNNLTNSSLL